MSRPIIADEWVREGEAYKVFGQPSLGATGMKRIDADGATWLRLSGIARASGINFRLAHQRLYAGRLSQLAEK